MSLWQLDAFEYRLFGSLWHLVARKRGRSVGIRASDQLQLT